MEDENTHYMHVVESVYQIAREDPEHEAGEVLGSMTTPPPPEALRVLVHYIAKNLGDPVLFGSLSKTHENLSTLTKRILRLPDHPLYITSGGTESNIMALYVLSRFFGRSKAVFPETVHHSIWKACNLLKMECKSLRVDREGRIRADELQEELSGKNKVFVATMGTTEKGVVDDIEAVIDILEDTLTPIHIDAAFGGFTFPFTHPVKYDTVLKKLSEKTVFTLSADYHKFPGAPIPSGFLLLDERLETLFRFKAPYIPSRAQWGLLGTRPGYSVAASLVTLVYYGERGLKDLAVERYGDALWFTKRVSKDFNSVEVNNPEVPISCVYLPKRKTVDIIRFLWKKKLYVYGCSSSHGFRVVHMPHVKRNSLRKLLDALREYLS